MLYNAMDGGGIWISTDYRYKGACFNVLALRRGGGGGGTGESVQFPEKLYVFSNT